MKYLSAVLFFFALAGCQSGQNYDHNYQPRTMFKTTPPSRLYFKNMRSAYYEQLTGRPDSMDYFRLRSFPNPTNRPVLQAVLADNWLRDEAYLLLEFNAFPQVPRDTFTLFWRGMDRSGALSLGETTPEAQRQMVLQLLEVIDAGYQVFWHAPDGIEYTLFGSDPEREALRVTVTDFRRITADGARNRS